MPVVDTLIEEAGDWCLYPVYRLPSKGRWATEKAVLLSDTADPLPPQGGGAGMVLEDIVALARLIGRYGVSRLKDVFTTYKYLRRAKIDAAYDEATFHWETNKDSGWTCSVNKRVAEAMVPLVVRQGAKSDN